MLAGVRTICAQAVTFVALVSALLLISWQAFVVLMALIPIATAMSIGVSRRIRELTGLERDREAELVGVLGKAVGAFKLVCTFGMAAPTVAAHDRRLDEALSSGYRRFKVVRTLQAASDVTMVVSDACSIFVGALFVFRNQMTLGSFIAFMNAFWRSATTLIALFKSWAELQSYAATVDRIDVFLRSAPAPVPQQRAAAVVLRAADLAFGYGSEPIFRNFSIALHSGERALIVGANGTGKTTLANVLAGYLEPSSGRILRPARISAVTLPLLFPPLKVGDLGADPALLSLLDVGSEEIAQSYPDELSAGQQQKIALSLALSKEADLYVLDEPTANLDPASRTLAMELIADRTRGRMLILIMHGADEQSSLFDQVLCMTAAGTTTRMSVAEPPPAAAAGVS
jgi:ATP-binding cassette subfamily B protein